MAVRCPLVRSGFSDLAVEPEADVGDECLAPILLDLRLMLALLRQCLEWRCRALRAGVLRHGAGSKMWRWQNRDECRNWGMAKQTSTAVPRWKKAVPDLGAQRELRLDALYRVAAAAFRRNGYHGTSLVDIARELGVSKPTLYHYIANKQDLLFQCHLVAADQAIAAICDDPALSGLEKVRRTIANYIVAIIGEESASVVILEEKSLGPEQLDVVIARRDIFDGRIQGLIEEGLADGTIAPCDAKLALFSALGAANWVTKWYRPTGPLSVAQIAEGVADLVCSGLRAPVATQACA
ncbi:MAG TPA: TetR/AcrR family transcriptional regulator [Bosea sp. (in: a-proteobacteria)]|jgi:AcrR family transcriptional regulator|uniref:TetR/AcrR family transcriptional regulator n=1 Tax=Bosea sp. (in: a-proteobacteria) TaxID=1871050 RepID=UPI002E0E9D77|nr:TetR/AcrR family transcriptional regulator [Bosea sp. (in: a-proteobacteria)]